MSLIVKELKRLDDQFFSKGEAYVSALGIEDKRKLLKTDELKEYLVSHRWLADIYESSDSLGKVALASLIAIRQADDLLQDPDLLPLGWSKWHHFLESMKDLELFYSPMGGIIGYQRHLLQCLAVQLGQMPSHRQEVVTYRKPPRIDIRKEDDKVRSAIQLAIENWSKVALMMPVGGAGDRLGLEDEKGHSMPAAFLPFEGYNLLEGIIKDVEAIERMIEQVTGVRYYTPIAMMTSDEKDNHRLIEQMLADSHHFGRPAESFRLFGQKRVPVVTEFGQWAMEGPLEPIFKPGGHGVIWRAAEVSGVFDWFRANAKTHALIRQINNPLAGSDYNMLALAGFAMKLNQSMGFMSCERLVHTSEGMNVWRTREVEGKKNSAITNVEYTDFIQEGIEDTPQEPGSHFSSFSSNTNLFVVKLEAIHRAIESQAFPGLILNLKSKSTIRVGHELNLVRLGRLESMMQNIADHLEVETEEEAKLEQFLLFNDRAKVISVAKAKAPEVGYANETPPSAFFDKQMMWRQLLTSRCQVQMPLSESMEEYYHRFPPFVLRLSPLLGPLHVWLTQRIVAGTLARGSYLDLDLCHFLARDFYLDGALRIRAKQPQKAYVQLRQVTLVNTGWSEESPREVWKGKTLPKSLFDIEFEGSGYFIAEQVSLEGSRKVVVPDGMIVSAHHDEFGALVLKEEPMHASTPTPFREFAKWARHWLGMDS